MKKTDNIDSAACKVSITSIHGQYVLYLGRVFWIVFQYDLTGLKNLFLMEKITKETKIAVKEDKMQIAF